MRTRGYKFFVRKAHRYLGVLIGIQFVFWTLGGIYFSWTKIDEVRGDDLRGDHMMVPVEKLAEVSGGAFAALAKSDAGARIMKLQLVEVLGEPHFEINYHDSSGKMRTALARAGDGALRAPMNEDEARRIAAGALKSAPRVVSASLVTNVATDDEYREKPLPAWKVEFDGGLNVYVAAESGQVAAVRNPSWRIFDFLWMLHTLDFKARDDINNWLLRSFSVLGLVTIASGFALFIVSSKRIRGIFRRTSA